MIRFEPKPAWKAHKNNSVWENTTIAVEMSRRMTDVLIE